MNPDNGSSVLPASPKAGVGMHFSSLPGAYGIGDIGDSSLKFVDAMVEMGISVWQFLPTGPTAYGDSPYQPLSAFAGNENLIGLEPLIRDGLLTGGDVEALLELPFDHVDFGRLIPLKQQVLSRAASNFSQLASSSMKSEYEDFVDRYHQAWLDDYALYRILKTIHGEQPWTEWASEYVHREPAAMDQLRHQYAGQLKNVTILQFLFDRQWKQLKQHATDNGIQLFGDMPIYIALDSSDAWAHPEILLIDRDGRPSHVAGVPPDYFSEDGQLWGNPLYDWEHHDQTGYQWWVERVKHSARMMDMVRVDHFRGFESFWSVPFGEETARNGAWVPGPRDALFQAMHAAMGDLPIVAEDLGVITEEVDGLRMRHHIPGMVVLQFQLADKAFNIDQVGQHSVCYTGTHDNDTTLGWFLGSDEDTRTEQEIMETRQHALCLTGGTADTIHTDVIRLAFSSAAMLAVAPMQDLLGLGSESRLNTPGTTSNNWRWRVLESQMSCQFKGQVRELVERSSRL